MNSIRHNATRLVVMAMGLILLSVGVFDFIRATNSTKTNNAPNILGYSGVWKFTGVMRANAVDTQYCPINGKNNTRDSLTVVVHTYTFGGTRTPFKVRWQTSMNGVTWKSTTLGTDSNTYSTTATTLATAAENDFPVGDARYGTWPYNRLLLTNSANVTTDSTRYEVYLNLTKNSQ